MHHLNNPTTTNHVCLIFSSSESFALQPRFASPTPLPLPRVFAKAGEEIECGQLPPCLPQRASSRCRRNRLRTLSPANLDVYPPRWPPCASPQPLPPSLLPHETPPL